MLFQYNLELTKLKKNGASQDEINALKNKLTINAPVIHLKHNEDFIKYIIDTKKNIKEPSGMQNDYVRNYIPKNATFNFFIQHNKEANTYNIFYKGFYYKNLSDLDIVKTIEKIDSYPIKNDFLYHKNSFVISNKHIGIDAIPYNKVLNYDAVVSKLKFPETTFDYFMKSSYPCKTFDLEFSGIDYGEKINIDRNALEKFREKNAEILYCHRSDTHEELVTFYNYFNGMKFKNLTLPQAMKVIETMKELDNLITKNQEKKRI